MDIFLLITTILALFFLVNSCVEVGSNDAANLVNAVYGSQSLSHSKAVFLAGLFVVLGASFSSPVMNTVRKSIFDVHQLDLHMTVSVFISAYFVSVTLLYIYSLFGMPVSTTATLVFCLAGGATGVLQKTSAVNWPQFSQVVLAIVLSIFISGLFAYFSQRFFRFFLGHQLTDPKVLAKHGSWITSLMLVTLLWFLLVKGMKDIPFVHNFHEKLTSGLFLSTMLTLWLSLTVFLKILIKAFGTPISQNLFRVTAILGMVSMAFAFGQNDLANCASPGLAIFMIWSKGLSDSLQMNVPIWSLSLCGLLMFLGMMTQRAKRVSMSEIRTGSQKSNIILYSPKWCFKFATKLLNLFHHKKTFEKKKRNKSTKESEMSPHYDSLRASVILSVSACVIAFASSQGLPISTTYVAFAAVIASGWGDRIFSKEQSEHKIGRTIWVISGWFIGAAGAFFASFFVAYLIYKTRTLGLFISFGTFLYFKNIAKKKSEKHAKKYDEIPEGRKVFLTKSLSLGKQQTRPI